LEFVTGRSGVYHVFPEGTGEGEARFGMVLPQRKLRRRLWRGSLKTGEEGAP